MACLVGRNIRTTIARNLRIVSRETGLNPWVVSSSTIKKVLSEQEDNLDIPVGDEWRLPYLALLLEQRQAAHYYTLEDEEQRICGLVDSLCKN